MQSEDLVFETAPAEKGKNGSLTSRALLRRPGCEAGFSAFSCNLNGFGGPNRDYAWEGFTANCGKEDWKFLDALFVRPVKNGEAFPLTATKVELSPWKAAYHYSAGNAKPVTVSYYLMRKPRHPCLCVAIDAGWADEIEFLPLADVRDCRAASAPGEHVASLGANGLAVVRHGMQLLISGGPKLERRQAQFTQHWNYKMGSGERGGNLKFIGESRNVFCPGVFSARPKAGKLELFLFAGQAGGIKREKELASYDEKAERSKCDRVLEKFKNELGACEKEFGKEKARLIAARLYCLLEKFGCGELLDAGAFWFRQPWFRDLFHEVFWDFDLFYKHSPQAVKRFVLEAFKTQKHGLVATRAGKDATYNGVDATVLCLLVAARLANRKKDPGLETAFEKAAWNFVEGMLNRDDVRIEQNRLLSCRANYSWTDVEVEKRFSDGAAKVPARIPDEWLGKTCAEASAVAGQRYFLAEVNALWVEFLREYAKTRKSFDSTRMADAAGESFAKIFLSHRLCPHIATLSGKTAAEATSPGLQALVMRQADAERLGAAWPDLRKITVKRAGKTFGPTVRETGPAFMNDGQYQGRSVWPRESLFLYKYLMQTGREQEAREVLESALDHSLCEGAAFFCNELFSPDPDGEVVPVKNPAQLWSQWTGAFFEYAAGKQNQ